MEIKDLVPSEKIPEVVDETGKKVIRPDILLMVTQLASLAQLARIRKSLEREHVEGGEEPKTLSATDELKWVDLLEEPPHKPWATAYFYNQDANNSVKIAINNPLKEYTIAAGEDWTLDHTKADERIERIFYRCDAGQTASVKAVGKY